MAKKLTVSTQTSEVKVEKKGKPARVAMVMLVDEDDKKAGTEFTTGELTASVMIENGTAKRK